MKLSELQEMWTADAKIDKDRAGEESLKIPLLHSKYLNMLYDERRTLVLLTEKRKQIQSKLEDYYGGYTDGKDIGREPWPVVYKVKDQITRAVDGDNEMVQLNLKIRVIEENISYCKDVLLHIHQRNFQIKNHIEFLKFTGGDF